MKVVIQRVKEASVRVEGEVCGSIDAGFLVLLGVGKEDKAETTQWLVKKLVDLRVFSDAEGKMNLCIKDIGGEVLVVSQFTLYGNCNNGRRRDFIGAAAPEFAEACYEKFVEEVKKEVGKVQTGKFGAKMEVSLVNDGPCTFILERV